MLKRMRKPMFFLVLLLVLMSAITMTSFAGQWKQDSVGWWYQNDDGSYPSNGWYWLDGNNDGIAECYYFDALGYMLANTVTPDDYTVNADGQWTVNSVVQTKVVAVNNTAPETGSGMIEITPENFWNYFRYEHDVSVNDSGFGEKKANIYGWALLKNEYLGKIVDENGNEYKYPSSPSCKAELNHREYEIKVDYDNMTCEFLQPTGKTLKYCTTPKLMNAYGREVKGNVGFHFDFCYAHSEEAESGINKEYILYDKEDITIISFDRKMFIAK